MRGGEKLTRFGQITGPSLRREWFEHCLADHVRVRNKTEDCLKIVAERSDGRTAVARKSEARPDLPVGAPPAMCEISAANR